ncbi:MAG: hypothetical protein PHS04_04570 [Tissierellia bacterium]|jgi:tetrahydromethanopterin S-methyltransferase subunit B|nr:hypothetical protein [Tissierellia bacterium]
MGGEERKCTELLRRVVGTKGFDTWICVVTAVGEACCDVERIFDKLKIKNVRLNATVKDNEGLIIYPAKNSYVLVTNIDNDKYFVSQFSQIEKITIDVNSNIVINGGKNEGLVKIKELTNKLNELKTTLNDLISAYNSHTHSVSTTGTAAAQTGTAAAIVSKALQAASFNKSDYENTKIKH